MHARIGCMYHLIACNCAHRVSGVAASRGYSSFDCSFLFVISHHAARMCTLMSGRCDMCRTYVHLASSPLSSRCTGGTGRVLSLIQRCCFEYMLLSLIRFFVFHLILHMFFTLLLVDNIIVSVIYLMASFDIIMIFHQCSCTHVGVLVSRCTARRAFVGTS